MPAHPKRENGHAERVRAIDARLAEGEKFVEWNAKLFGEFGEIFAHHLARERIIAGGHRRVRGENVCRRDDLKRGIEIEFLLRDFSANALEREKRGVPFVHVENLRIDIHRLERFHAADPEHDFLTHPHFLIAAVKFGGDQSVFGVVLRNVSIEQEQIDSADVELTDFREHFAIKDSNRNEKIRAVALYFANRQVMKILVQADRLLRAVLVDLLAEISVAIKQTDGDEV